MKAARTFDYVVVGAGTAGCVVASRLAATGASVALLEAGGPYRRVLDVPLLSLWASLRRPARYAWQDVTEPQAALDGRRISWPAGKLVGGSSAINAMIYCRGHPASYDRWQRLAGGQPDAPAWNYEALLPYFRRGENFEGGESVHHGTGGPIGVSASRYPMALSEAFLAGCDELGIRRTDDFNSGTEDGAGYLHVTQRHGRRTSSARYLHPGPDLGRPTVWLGSQVRRILFEARAGDGRRGRSLRRPKRDPRRTRGHPLRRRGAFAAVADAIGRGPRRRAAQPRHRRRRRSPRGWRQPAGPSPHASRVRVRGPAPDGAGSAHPRCDQVRTDWARIVHLERLRHGSDRPARR